ncbi:MAG: hypothetical protein Q8O99_03500 [bacterium]|nr:hypothetical protein [bacterium]
MDASKLMTNEDKQSVELLGDIFIKQMLNNQPHTKVRQINTDYLPSQTSSGMQTVSSAQDKNIS